MASAQDLLLAKFAVRAQLLTTDLLQNCFREQQELRATGREVPLSQIFVRRRLVSPEQLASIAKTVEAMTFDCFRCRTRFPFAALAASATLACPRCRGALTIRQADGELVSERISSSQRFTARAQVANTMEDTARVRPEKKEDISADVPKVFGPYAIIAELGRGGMGVVYKAHHPALDRVVALKVLLAGGMASSTQLRRFKREAELAGKLKHPSIVRIHDVGQAGNHAYFTMDYIDGVALSERIKLRDIPVRQAVEIARDIALALAHAHAQGVVHRDVKPANIIIDKEGTPFITDFGLAKELFGEHSKLTRSGAAVGTPFYMSPEQTQGEVEPSSDVYSLGCVLFEMLTYELPFTAKTQVELTRKILFEEPPRPASFEPAIDADVETIVLKTLRKEPQDRYTAEELAEDLGRYLAGEPIQARPRSTIARLRAKVRRHWVLALFLVLGIPALVALILGGIHYLEMRDELEEAQRKGLLGKTEDEKEARAKAEKEAHELETARLRGQALKEAEHAWIDVDRIPITATDALRDKIRLTIQRASEALRHDPRCARALLLRGRAQEASQASADALKDYARAREVEPDGPTGGEAAFREARLLFRRHGPDGERAKALYQALSKRTGTGIWQILGKASYLTIGIEKPERDQALAEIESALKLDPTCAEAYYLKAIVLAQDGAKPPTKEVMDCLNACLDADRKNARAYAERAMNRLRLGQEGAAEEDMAHAFALDPDDELALITRARMRASENKIAEALQDLTRILEMQKPREMPDILLEVASLSARNGQIEAAQRFADRAAEVAPGKPEPYDLMHRVYMRARRLDDAVRELERGLEACAKDEAAYDALGYTLVRLLAQTGHFDDAVAFAERAIKESPRSPGRRLMLANVYAGRAEGSDVDQALGLLEQIHADSPAYVEAYLAHFGLLKALGRMDECGVLAERLEHAAPSDIDALVAVSTTHMLRGRADDALAVARRALALDPRSAAANGQLAFLHYTRDELEDAVRFATAAVELDPESSQGLTILAATSAKQKRMGDAETYARRALEARPTNDNAASILMKVLLHEDKVDAAVRVGEAFLDRAGLESTPARVLVPLGEVYLVQKRDREAVSVLERAVADDPTDSQAHEDFAEALARTGDARRALAEAEAALKLDPGSQTAQRVKARLEGQK